MGADGTLIFDTKIDESGFEKGTSKLGNILNSGLGHLAGDLMSKGLDAIVGLGKAAMTYNADIEQYATSFEVMTGSAEKATQVVEELKKVGAETPFELKDLADTTQLLMNYGFTADDAIGKMMMLGDISQGSAEKMSRIATAYGQMSSAGKVSLEDVKQMIEARFNPLQEISESTGESIESLYDRISKGTISVDEITASMERATSEGGKYFQSMEKQSQTFNGLMSTLSDTAMQLLGEIVMPISSAMTDTLLPAAITTLEQLTTGFRENGVMGMISAAGDIISGFLMGVATNLPLVIQQGLNMSNQWISSILMSLPGVVNTGTQIISTLLNSLLENAPQIIEQAITMAAEWIQMILNALPSVLQSGANMILSLLSGLINNAPNIISQAATMLANYISEIASNLPEILQKGIEIIGELLAGIISKVPDLIAEIPGIISDIGEAFLDKDWAGIGWDIIMGVVDGVKNAAGNLVEAAAAAVDDALNWVKSKLGIASPSKVFRDEVGRYMAEGIGVGFEKNMPLDVMDSSLKDTINSLQRKAVQISSKQPMSVDNIARSASGSYMGSNIDYKKMEKAVKSGVNEANARPLSLDGRIISRGLAEEGFVIA